ncbi:MAG: cyclopropane-fatty-acyl-phospholipid synthase family protein [Thermoanaerobaculia bacterium]|nr:cyclopropane-fatty-acyl-phospholipid synthase family protein [Thermoanaerobaculia bacterium]
MRNLIDEHARKVMLKSLSGIEAGFLRIVDSEETHNLGDPAADLRAEIRVHDRRFFSRAIFGGEIGIGESYMDGDWSSDDLVSVIRIAVRNLSKLETSSRLTSLLSRLADTVRHRLKTNTIRGSARNIHAHYDLSNDFFRLFLDRNMLYSCAWFDSVEDSLETAQLNKIDRICRKLQLDRDDHVLEIGTGWGGFAIHAAEHYGCRVTTTTISREQFDLATARVREAGLTGRVEVLFEDYRQLKGTYDKIVSIEMFEAVGYEFYDEFFGACDRLLQRDGTMLLQTITMLDQKFHDYRARADWIQKHIFPGGELASLSEVLSSLARSTDMALFQSEDMGAHYAHTLREWRQRFRKEEQKARMDGFDDVFLRGWDYYLGYCEGAFLERHISAAQLLLTKTHSQRQLVNEPWSRTSAPLRLVAGS